MRRLTVFLTVLICFALLACSGSGSSSSYVVPKSEAVLYDLYIYEYECDGEWVFDLPTTTIYEGKCYAAVALASKPLALVIKSGFGEITYPTGEIEASGEVVFTSGSNDWTQGYVFIAYGQLPELWCGAYNIELWIKDINGLDSNSVFTSVTAGSPCAPVGSSLAASIGLPAIFESIGGELAE